MKILCGVRQFNPEAKKIIEQLGHVDYQESTSRSSLKNLVASVKSTGLQYDVILVDLKLVDQEVINGITGLKVIATVTTGIDHIDADYAKEKGIKVFCLQSDELEEVTGTAEHALYLIGALVHKIPFAFDDVKQGRWNREKFVGRNLYGKTLGIFGLGRLGKMMAKYGKVLGMNVIACDPKSTTAEVKMVDFDTLLHESDIISIHASLNKDTKEIFDKSAFEKMKSAAYLVNTARGDIVKEADLLNALSGNPPKIAGYATDVLAGENYFTDYIAHKPLIAYAQTHDNVIITPHIGGMQEESRAATDIIIAQKVKEYIQTL